VLDVFSVLVHFDVSQHLSYRFRLVSISCDPSFTFSIDGHQMTIIEVEGVNVKPLLVDSLNIFVGMCGFVSSRIVLIHAEIGQRYSVVVRQSSHLCVLECCASHTLSSMPTNLLITTVCITLASAFRSLTCYEQGFDLYPRDEISVTSIILPFSATQGPPINTRRWTRL
jgi:hypothetical protein